MTDVAGNAFHRLRTRRLAEATREFMARGKSVVRCELCQLAKTACICPWRPTRASGCEFVLLMHRDEVLKPTNSGRLIADVFPAHTHAFCWSRTEPDVELLRLLNDPARLCLLVFPADDAISGERSRSGGRKIIACSLLYCSMAPGNKVAVCFI